MAHALMFGAPSRIKGGSAVRTSADNLRRVGFNSGNLLIGHSLLEQLAYRQVDRYSGWMTHEFIDENYDQIIIAAANFLHSGFDFSNISALLEKTRLPVFMIGLGAQAPNRHGGLESVPEGTWRLVRIAAERSHSVGVRGNYTAELLAANGIQNVVPVGCPSLFCLRSPIIRIVRNSATPTRVVANGSRDVTGHSMNPSVATRIEREVFRLAMSKHWPYVLQSEQPEIGIVWDGASTVDENLVDAVAHDLGLESREFVRYLRESGKVFFSVAEWFKWIKGYEFSFGTRLHGNLAALLNGIPAFIFAHDARTEEICELASIPYLPITDVEALDVAVLHDRADYGKFEARYREIYRVYASFLVSNNIPNRLDTGCLPPDCATID